MKRAFKLHERQLLLEAMLVAKNCGGNLDSDANLVAMAEELLKLATSLVGRPPPRLDGDKIAELKELRDMVWHADGRTA